MRLGTADYRLSAAEVAQKYHSCPETGLSREEAAQRLARYGPNTLREARRRTPWQMLLDQFKEALVIVLLIAAVISAFLGEGVDSLVILGIVLLNAILGVVQEYRAEKSLAALKKLSAPVARVLREGEVQAIPAAQLVPGDIVFLEAGDFVPADGRLLETVNLQVDESALTGESVPVSKETGAIAAGVGAGTGTGAETSAEGEIGLGDQRNMVFMSTIVTQGRGRVLVTRTGMETEIGRVAELLETAPQMQTPLQERLEKLGKTLGLVALGLCAVIFLVGVLRGIAPLEMFMIAVSLAVAAIPEGLPAVVTIVLALGVQRLIKRNAIIRKLPAVETLGSATVICSDKTGTLTQNAMTVQRLYAGGKLYAVSGEGYAPVGEITPLEEMGSGEGQEPEGKEGRTAPSSAVGVAAGSSAETQALVLLLAAGALANNAEVRQEETEWRVVGDPTEGAMVVVAAKAGLTRARLMQLLPRVAELPFDSERKRMTTLHNWEPNAGAAIPGEAGANIEKRLALALATWAQAGSEAEQGPPRTTSGSPVVFSFTKGAPDLILERCTTLWDEGGIKPLTTARRAELLALNERLGGQALRVLAVAGRIWPDGAPTGGLEPESVETELVFLGFEAMLDPPREEVREAIRICQRAGIRPVMITGDHRVTAVAIARSLGILEDTEVAEKEAVLTGAELESLSQEELEARVEKVQVYARVSPEHKLRIVAALQKQGHIAAMTGDGVNDAPALKHADIGAAMGITGTDVAKEAAEMVLADDNFATIVAAVHEGRIIYANIKKAIRYLLSCNTGELAAIFCGILFGFPRPLTAIQILWVNLVTDSLPALALGVEPAEPGLMAEPPRDPREGVFARGMGSRIFWEGLYIGTITLLAFWFGWRMDGNPVAGRTMAFAVLALSQLAQAFNCRSENLPLWRLGLGSNRALNKAILVSGLLQLAVLVFPVLQRVFGTRPLTALEWVLVAALAASPLLFGEIRKGWERRRVMEKSWEGY